jgi:hypothetical protein
LPSYNLFAPPPPRFYFHRFMFEGGSMVRILPNTIVLWLTEP